MGKDSPSATHADDCELLPRTQDRQNCASTTNYAGSDSRIILLLCPVDICIAGTFVFPEIHHPFDIFRCQVIIHGRQGRLAEWRAPAGLLFHRERIQRKMGRLQFQCFPHRILPVCQRCRGSPNIRSRLILRFRYHAALTAFHYILETMPSASIFNFPPAGHFASQAYPVDLRLRQSWANSFCDICGLASMEIFHLRGYLKCSASACEFHLNSVTENKKGFPRLHRSS